MDWIFFIPLDPELSIISYFPLLGGWYEALELSYMLISTFQQGIPAILKEMMLASEFEPGSSGHILMTHNS